MQTEVTYSARPPWGANEVDRLDIGEGFHHASAAGYANQLSGGQPSKVQVGIAPSKPSTWTSTMR